MLMSTNEILTLVSIVATAFVGVILSRQIKSQKALIRQYEGYMNAINPEKVTALHDRIVEQLTQANEFDKKQLETQLLELAIYVDYYLTGLYKTHFPDTPDRKTHIIRNMPHCEELLNRVHEYYHPTQSKE